MAATSVPRARVPADEGRGGVLPRHAGRGAVTPVAGHGPVVSPENVHPFGTQRCAPVRRWTGRSCATCSRTAFARRRSSSVDSEFRAALRRARAPSSPDQIGKAGQLQEWLDDWDMEAPELHHRHVSHLYALFPSDRSRCADTPELAAAARRSLEIRGDEATGWAIGWRLNLWARLQRRGARVQDPRAPADARPHLSEHVRRTSAFPDRRQFRRHGRHRRNAAAEPVGRDRAVAGLAGGLAHRRGQGAPCARRL